MKLIKTIVVVTAVLMAGTARAEVHESSDSLSRQLHEVVVTAKQPATRLVGSTLVSTIQGSPLAQLGNALDVLAQLPMITVVDDVVSVVGKRDVEIYIDGRPMRDNLELHQILSGNLKKVELLMAPGAEYANSTGAVLKITTRRGFVQGLSLTDQFQLRRRRKWSVMNNLGMSYSIGNWELFVNATANHNNSLVKGVTTNSLVFDGRETVVGGSQSNSNPVTVGVVKAGFNYSKGAQSFGAYYRYNPEKGDFNNTGTEWLDSEPAVAREIDRHISSHSHLASVYYENKFSDRVVLHFDGDFRQSEANSNVATTYPASAGQDVSSADRRTSALWAGKLSLGFPR
ncbi:MAG: hypothetical protein K2O10_06970, partial [Muribaculaceae bacterium]|nr:hypothetical protein [Muribaculaceae bacterium]